MPHIHPESISAAIAHLSSADPIMRDLIEQVGPFRMKLETNRFRALVRAIVAQQISTKAARSIQKKLEGLLPGALNAENLSRLTPVELRSAGLSPQKIGYV